MLRDEFYNKMNEDFEATPQFSNYQSLNELTTQFVSQLETLSTIKLISISSGKVNKNEVIPPHLILICNEEGAEILNNLLFELQCELFDKRTLIRYIDQVVMGICIEFNYSVQSRRSVYRDFKKWWNILFKLFNRYFKLKIKLHRTW